MAKGCDKLKEKCGKWVVDVVRKSATEIIVYYNVGKAKSISVSSGSITALDTAPASAGATGETGEIRVTATHIYWCIAPNTWVRAAGATW